MNNVGIFFVIIAAVFLAEAQVVPPDWQPRVAQAQMLFSQKEPTDTKMMPAVGNGYVSTIVGSDTIYMAGVFNGEATAGPSHRALIPSTNAFTVVNSVPVASALDLEKGVYYRRSRFSSAMIEQRWYAHRALRSILVHEIDVDNSGSSSNIEFQLALNTRSSGDIQITPLPNGTNYYHYAAKTLIPELPNGIVTQISVASTKDTKFYTVPARQKTTLYFISAFRSNLDSQDPVQDAITDFNNANKLIPNLMNSHLSAWADLWNSRIEVGGDFFLSQVVNSTLYYILSSVRDDWPWSLSPGSLSSNSYNGHTFWDTETWMYPPLLVCFPKIARDGVLQYRFNTKDGAAAKAKSYNKGYQGYMFAWESAFTGDETCPVDAPTGELEHHITGDVAFAFQQYWYLSNDLDWLKKAWVIINGIAEFWASRVSFNSTTSRYEIKGVIPPDEYAVDVNNSVYTNVVASISLNFATEAGGILGITVPAQWQTIANNMQITSDNNKDIHLEFDGYNGQLIKQADVILLSYPLMLPMTNQRRKNNLDYYSQRTDKGGPAMTYSMETIGWLELGMLDKAAAVWPDAYANAQQPFLVWTETAHPPGGAVNFITGAGGFLQGIISGLGGLRLTSNALRFNPQLFGKVTSLKFRSLHYRNNDLQFDISSSSVTVTLTNTQSNSGILILTDPTGKAVSLQKGIPVTFATGQFTISPPAK